MQRTCLGLALLALVGCGKSEGLTGPSEVTPIPMVEVTPTWRMDRSDLLNYFLGHGREDRALYSRQAGHSISLEWEGGQGSGHLWWTKWVGASEYFRWDSTGIYLVEDHSASQPYSFSSGMWFPRHARAGDRGRNLSNAVTWYGAGCVPAKSYRFAFEWYVESITQEEMVIHYIWGPGNVEINTYSWENGWVRWRYVSKGKTLYDFRFEQPGSQVSRGDTCIQ